MPSSWMYNFARKQFQGYGEQVPIQPQSNL